MMRGITPVISVILLLIITVAIMGLAYGFISGFFGTVTGKAAIVSGQSSCSSGAVNIYIRNAGTGPISISADGTGVLNGDATVIRTSGGIPTWQPRNAAGACALGGPCLIQPQEAGTLQETTTICGAGQTCTYDVSIGGILFPTRARCT